MMNVTDEMMKAGIEALVEQTGGFGRHDNKVAVKAILDAALSAAPVPAIDAEGVRKLIKAVDDIELGRSIHNNRKPDQRIDGPLWDVLRKARHEADASLRAPAQPVAVDGWKLVPIKPTDEMIKNAAKDHEGENWLPHSLWTSMLAASPTPPEGEGK